MPYLFEAWLLLMACCAFWLWRALHPGMEPARRFLFLAVLVVVLSLVCAVWYGFGRRGGSYVPARIENGVLVPAQSGAR